MAFSEKIIEWYDEHKRDLPWRETKDPYKIWLSEIIMQQTQIIQGTGYYLQFIETFPTVFDLAQASENDVLLLWQGLGYYSRARNLHKTAIDIVELYSGVFPKTYEELIKLKGVGDYTASELASICFDLPHSAVDGNVLRVISRVFGVETPINKTAGRNKIRDISKSLILKERPGDYNQAVMDFGSQYCKTNNPDCENCIFKNECFAFIKDIVSEIPVKEKAKPKTKAYYNYFICTNDAEDLIVIKQRVKGIWKNLFEFPKIFSNRKQSEKTALNNFIETYKVKHKIKLCDASSEYKHSLSHKDLFIKFYRVKLSSKKDIESILNNGNSEIVERNDLKNYPFPIIIKKYIEEVLLQ